MPEGGKNRFIKQEGMFRGEEIDSFSTSGKDFGSAYEDLNRREKVQFITENRKIVDELANNQVNVPENILKLPPPQQRIALNELQARSQRVTKTYARE